MSKFNWCRKEATYVLLLRYRFRPPQLQTRSRPSHQRVLSKKSKHYRQRGPREEWSRSTHFRFGLPSGPKGLNAYNLFFLYSSNNASWANRTDSEQHENDREDMGSRREVPLYPSPRSAKRLSACSMRSATDTSGGLSSDRLFGRRLMNSLTARLTIEALVGMMERNVAAPARPLFDQRGRAKQTNESPEV